MDSLFALIQTIGGVSSGASGLITLALVLMYMIDKGWIHLGKNGNGNKFDKQAYDLMQYLKTHYNDALSEDLKELHKKQDTMLNYMHEWDKFGIPIRGCEKPMKSV